MSVFRIFAALAFVPAFCVAQTLEWDQGEPYPPGTTYRVIINGAEFSELTERQFDLAPHLPGPGQHVDLQVQAVAPSEPICGPAADKNCKDSDLVGLAFTIPNNPSGMTFGFLEVQEMPVNLVGTHTTQSTAATRSAGTQSVPVNIPVGARSALIAFDGYIADVDPNASAVTLNGNSATDVLDTADLPENGSEIQVLHVPLTAGDEGAGRILQWTRNADLVEGGNIVIGFYDQAGTPFRDSAMNKNQVEGSAMTVTVSGQAGDAFAVFATEWRESPIVWVGVNDTGARISGQDQTTGLGHRTLTANETDTAVGRSDLANWPGVIAITLASGVGPVTETEQAGLDAVVQSAGLLRSASLDAVLQASGAQSISLDAIVSATATGQISIDAALQIATAVGVSIDAVLQAMVHEEVSLDAVMVATGTTQAEFDALLVAIAAGLAQTNLEALLQTTEVSSASIDAILAAVSAKTVSVNLDALLEQSGATGILLDGVLVAEQSLSSSLEAVLAEANQATVNLDAVVQFTAQGVTSLDAMLAQEGQNAVGTGLDALLLAVNARTLSLDAALKVSGVETLSLDAVLAAGLLASVGMDALLEKVAASAVGLDGALQVTKLGEVSLDSVIGAIRTETLSLDAAIALLGLSSVSMDSILQGHYARIVGLDAAIGDITFTPLPNGRIAIVYPDGRTVIAHPESRTTVLVRS